MKKYTEKGKGKESFKRGIKRVRKIEGKWEICIFIWKKKRKKETTRMLGKYKKVSSVEKINKKVKNWKKDMDKMNEQKGKNEKH